MSFSAIGDCQLLSQIYNYKGHRIPCSIKVLPTPVTHFEREATNDYHWMTAARWARIESALWRLFGNLAQWEDAKKLNEQLLIDHINVRVQATEKPQPGTQSLLAGAELAPEDVCLDIQLQYMTGEDTTIVGVLTTKRKLATDAEANGTAKIIKRKTGVTGKKAKAGIHEKPSQAKPKKHIDADDDGDGDCPAASGSQTSPTKPTRRSLSQGDGVQNQGTLTNGHTSRPGKKLTNSPIRRISRASSDDSKAARRSGRSPIRPNRFNNFILGQTQQRKRKVGEPEVPKTKAKPKPSPVKKPKAKPSPVKKPKEKPVKSPATKAVKEKTPTPAPTEALKVEQLDGVQLDALQRLDNMLTEAKPPEVEILLLENMGEADVLATFERYKGDFDSLFEERRHKSQTLNYMRICHMDVMDILNADIRNAMIKKLGDTYSTQSRHASLLINAMLPLWIVLLFRDTYNLSQGDAVLHIKAQMQWNSYKKALNNEPLSSDLGG